MWRLYLENSLSSCDDSDCLPYSVVYVFATRSVYPSSQFDINYDSHKYLSYEAVSLFLMSVLFVRVSLMSPRLIDNRSEQHT